MQTTKNTELNHVERLGGATHPSDNDGDAAAASPPAAVDGSGVAGAEVLDTLINQEALLRYHAEELERAAAKREHEGDEAAQRDAGEMRSQAGTALAFAAETRQTIDAIRKDPHKKVSLRKIEMLQAKISAAIGMGEEEMESAEVAHDGAEDHRHKLKHYRMAKAEEAVQKFVEKHTKTSAPIVKKPAEKKAGGGIHGKAELKKKHGRPDEVHDAPEVEKPKEEGLLAKAKAKVKSVAKTAWNAVTETAEEVAEDVGGVFSVGVRCLKKVGGKMISAIAHSSPVVAVGSMASSFMESRFMGVVLHPIDTVRRLMGHTEEAPVAVNAVASVTPVRSAVSGKVIEAISGLTLPSLKAETVHHAGEWFAPLMPFRQATPNYALIPIC